MAFRSLIVAHTVRTGAGGFVVATLGRHGDCDVEQLMHAVTSIPYEANDVRAK